MKEHYLVLRSNPYDFELLEKLEAALCESHIESLKHLSFSHRDDLDIDLIALKYCNPENDFSLSVVDDYQIPLRYLILTSHNDTIIYSAIKEITEKLPVISLAELQHEAKQNMEIDPKSLLQLGIGAGSCSDAESLSILRTGFRSINSLVRFRAVQGAGMTQWVEFIKDLENLAMHDTSPEVKAMATMAIEKFNS
jgi:hypothetical protein